MTETLEEIIEEFKKIGVIRVDKKGNIHHTKFGQEVYDHMKKHGMFKEIHS